MIPCLRQYARTFAANDIDLDVLGELTDADLEKFKGKLRGKPRIGSGADQFKWDAEALPPTGFSGG